MARFSLRAAFLFTAVVALVCGAGFAGNQWCMAILNTVIPLLFGYALLSEAWLKRGNPFWQGFLAFGLAYWLLRPARFDDTGDIFHWVYMRFIWSPWNDLPQEIKREGRIDEAMQNAGLLAVASTGGMVALWLKRDRSSPTPRWVWGALLLPAAIAAAFLLLMSTMHGSLRLFRGAETRPTNDASNTVGEADADDPFAAPDVDGSESTEEELLTPTEAKSPGTRAE